MEESIRREEEGDAGSQLKQRRLIRGLIGDTNNYSQFKEVAALRWPKECFARTLLKPGKCPTNGGDIVFLKSAEDPEMNLGAAKRMRKMFLELEDLEGDKWETLVLTSKRSTENGNNKEWERQLHVGKLRRGEAMYAELEGLKKHRSKGLIPIEKGTDPQEMAKMLECIMKDTDIMMDIYSNKLGREGEARETFKNNALLVKTSNENYAETLKKVKEEIELCGKKVDLKKIRSTRGGDMIVELKEGESGKDLQEMIRKGNRGIETRLLDKDFRKRKKYVMRDFDAVTRKEEVETKPARNSEDSGREGSGQGHLAQRGIWQDPDRYNPTG